MLPDAFKCMRAHMLRHPEHRVQALVLENYKRKQTTKAIVRVEIVRYDFKTYPFRAYS
jgi:hypothetical protein